jgi:hypothetical protein
MSTNKELTKDKVGPDDLERNPGIGQSKGTFATGQNPVELEGENTFEADVDNDTTATDGVRREDHSRTNK